MTSKAENHLDSEVAKWFAIYTPYKREKLALKNLTRKGIKAYLPLQKIVRQYTRKTKKTELPLISCYVFVKITKEEYVKVLETEYILNFVRFSKNLISIPDNEIEMMQQILGEGIEVNAEERKWREGNEVEIIQGNLTGLRGKLVAIEGKKRVIVALETLGYELQINIAVNMLRQLAIT